MRCRSSERNNAVCGARWRYCVVSSTSTKHCWQRLPGGQMGHTHRPRSVHLTVTGVELPSTFSRWKTWAERAASAWQVEARCSRYSMRRGSVQKIFFSWGKKKKEKKRERERGGGE